jgi:hypothetical protein
VLYRRGAINYNFTPDGASTVTTDFTPGCAVVLFHDPRRCLSIQEKMVTKNSRQRFYLLAGAVLFVVGANQVRAIYGMDMGFFGGFNPVPSPTQFINSHALIRAGQGSSAPGPLRINNHPDSAANRARNSGFSPHYGLDSRRSPAFEVDRRLARPFDQATNKRAQQALEPVPAPAPTSELAAVARQVFPIGSFFDASRRLVWPSESPIGDNLQAKRDISDEACLVVSDKVERYRSAPITLVTVAREKLLAYGQPALQAARSTTTPRIAEGFHNFLLSLYDSLAQAANPPTDTAATGSAR